MARALPGQVAASSFRALRFGVVGLTGVGVNQATLVFLTEVVGFHYLASAILATESSTLWNFGWIDRWALAGRARGTVARRLLAYAAVNNATLLVRLPILFLLTDVAGIAYGVSNLITLAILFVLRFVISDRWIWGVVPPPPAAVAVATTMQIGEAGLGDVGLGEAGLGEAGLGEAGLGDAARPEPPEHEVLAGFATQAPHRYDIGGIVRLDSEAELPELAFFRTAATTRPDIRVRIDLLGSWPSRAIRFSAVDGRLSYYEHLGLAGANFEIELGDPIDVVVSPLLARSRHVLYTNIVEALLRFALVERGYVLLHSGCVSRNGRATLLSAQTDTGKTSTVIRLVRDFGFAFLSDDMTIVSPNGIALRYPKPMTMSYHTMATIAGTRLPLRKRAALSVQSRVHSKSGRSIGRALGTRNIPIMAINSATQIAVPPPKFHISALVGCEIAERATIDRVVLMERGESLEERLGLAASVSALIENTDDAYGFPPFATFAPHLRMGALSYVELRQR